jgi:hypothetical protein
MTIHWPKQKQCTFELLEDSPTDHPVVQDLSI